MHRLARQQVITSHNHALRAETCLTSSKVSLPGLRGASARPLAARCRPPGRRARGSAPADGTLPCQDPSETLVYGRHPSWEQLGRARFILTWQRLDAVSNVEPSSRTGRSIRCVPDNGRDSRGWSWPRLVRVSRTARQEADRRAGEVLVSLLDQAGKAEVDGLLARGEFIRAVRRVRERTGLRLIDAKRLVSRCPSSSV
jgi:hypothetical protein